MADRHPRLHSGPEALGNRNREAPSRRIAPGLPAAAIRQPSAGPVVDRLAQWRLMPCRGSGAPGNLATTAPPQPPASHLPTMRRIQEGHHG